MAKSFLDSDIDVLMESASGIDTFFENTLKKEQNEIGKKNDKKRGRPKSRNTAIELNATFVLYEKQLEAIRALAFWRRQSIKNFVIRMVDSYLSSHNDELKQALEVYRNEIKLQKMQLEELEDKFKDDE